MGVVRAFCRPAGDVALLQLCRRQIRSSPRYPVSQPGDGGRLRRGYKKLDHHAGGRQPLQFALPDYRDRAALHTHPAPDRGTRRFQGRIVPHRAMAEGAGGFHRQARGGDRHRRDRHPDHPDHCGPGRPSHGVSAHGQLGRAAAQRQDRRRNAGQDQGRLSRDFCALPRDLRLLHSHARPAQRVRGIRRGTRGQL
jgi:hypothetical protein